MASRVGMPGRKAWRGRLFCSGAALLAVMATTAASADADDTAATTGASSGGIEQVVVTATRRAQTLDKVPISVSAFTEEQMEDLNVKSFADLARYTPGVKFNQDSKDISIRGIDSTAGTGTTGIYIDDTPIQIRVLGLNSNNTLPTVYDIDRVEVLRGPQGTLFGAGSEGGTVRYITPQPSLTDFTGKATIEVSGTEDGAPNYEVGAAFGGPLVENELGFRASAWYRRDGGWIDRVNYQTGAVTIPNSNETDTYVFRGALTWEPIANLKITPALDYQNRQQHDINDYWTAISDPGNGKFRSGTPDTMPDNDHFYLGSLNIAYDFDGMSLIANTSYFNRTERVSGYSGTLYNLSFFQQSLANGSDPAGVACAPGQCQLGLYPLLTPTGLNLPGMPDYVAQNHILNSQRDLTQEVRLQSSDPNARFVWVVGLFYSYNTQESREEINDPQLPALTQYLWGETMQQLWGLDLLANGDDYINDTHGHDRQIAGYADATYALTDKVRIEAGIRYAFTHFDFTNFADGPQNFGHTGGPGSKDETPLTPKGGFTYQATQDDMFYATVAKGYRIGGANPPIPQQECAADLSTLGIAETPSSFSSDSVISYELGAKNKFFGGKLQTSESAYHIDWNHIQQSLYLTSCGFRLTTNLGPAVSDGFDFEAEAIVFDAFELNAGVSFTDAHYTADQQLQGADPAGAIIVYRGDSLDIPPWTVTLGAEYNFSLFGRSAFIRADYEYASRDNRTTPQRHPGSGTYDSSLVPDPGTSFVSARGEVQLGNWDVALFAENLLNAHPQLDLNHQDQYTLLYEATTFRPRTMGVAINYRY
ncbi:MAG TPA: TonB-dependent receptor [Rhizomicrobium sp.]|nr:TonB-dependent receptor [Rhizomicrobium sp.]